MDEKTINKLKAVGLIKEKYDDYKRIFSEFNNEYKNTGSKMEAYTKVGLKLGYSDVTIQRAVKVMSSL